MYALRDEKKYVIGWALLSERTSFDAGVVCDAALDLRHNGFFDTRSREIGVVSLNEELYAKGPLRAQAQLVATIIKSLPLWQFTVAALGILAAVILWALSNVAYDLLKYIIEALANG